MRTLALAIAVVALLGFAGYTGFAAVVGSDDLLHPGKMTDCRTPANAYDWPYEAINYSLASDRALKPVAPAKQGDNWTCNGTPAPAGTEIITTDGIRLAGWYISAPGLDSSEPTILLVHGRGSNKSDYLRYAVPLHDTYNIVVFDQRGAGQSSDAPNTLGVTEQRDLTAELDWLMATKHPTWVGVVGTSMGAATALAVAVGDQRIDALVLDSMHARIAVGTGRALERDKHVPAFPTQAAMFFGAWLRTGVDLSAADPIGVLPRLEGRPVLLLHGSADEYDLPGESLQLNVDAARRAGVDVESHVCEGAGHDTVIDMCPTDWSSWVGTFLASARHR